MNRPAFKTNDHNDTGFHMTFTNGWTVSVQWGEHNYRTESTAEVGVWDAEGVWLEWSRGDPVEGHMTPVGVAELLVRISSIHPAKDADYFSHIDTNSLELETA